jgi:hypothetical protein
MMGNMNPVMGNMNNMMNMNPMIGNVNNMMNMNKINPFTINHSKKNEN